jgi:ketosteroid isomerase-like protein
MDRARAELERADEAWCAAAAAARDVEQIVSFWADDAIVFPPGQTPIIGKNAIRNYVTDSLKIPGFSIEWKTTRFAIARDCDLAYGVGHEPGLVQR